MFYSYNRNNKEKNSQSSSLWSTNLKENLSTKNEKGETNVKNWMDFFRKN